MTNVKPEHATNAAFLAMLLVRPTDGNGNVPESRAVEVIAALIQERDTARADARVLAEELDVARLALEGGGENVGVEVTVTTEPRPHLSIAVHPERLADWKKARIATDASGALERSRP